MRAVVQRVKSARVEVEGETIGTVDHGLLVFLGVTHSDTEKDAKYLAEKIAGLRIFEDAEDKMNLSVQDVGGSILSVTGIIWTRCGRHCPASCGRRSRS